MPRFEREALLAAVLLVVTLLVGVAGGVALERFVLRERRPSMMARSPGMGAMPRDPAELRLRYTRQLASALELTPEQRRTADSLIRLQQQEARAAMRALRPRLDSINARTEQEIRTLLTPEQRQRWEQFRARRRP